jgi:16S rRNA (adenine1518-N6/adenine1519-N6)-dimethyltransferase
MENVLMVPPDAFWPPPKNDSAVVRMIPAAHVHGQVQNEALFEQVVAQAFAQRRKTLHNNLKGLFDDAALTALGIDPGLRAENLTVAQYVQLANALAVPA